MAEESWVDWKPLPICGDVELGGVVVQCDCGKYRQADRPHGYKKPTPNKSPAKEDR